MKNLMNNFAWTAVITAVSAIGLHGAPALAATYKMDPSHSEVGFTVKHLVISNVKGRFNKFEGSFDYDEKTKTVSKVDVKIDVASVDTNDKKRDEHLASPEFFDVKTTPSMTFVAEKATNVISGKNFKLPGTLTIHGVSKPVILDATFNGQATDPWGNEKIVFSATTKIKRSEFGVKWNKTMDKGGVVVGEDVTINIESESNKDKVVAK